MTSEDTPPTETFPPRSARATVSERHTAPGFFRQVAAHRWAKPLVRVLSIALALVVLAAIGSSARAVTQTVAPVIITADSASVPSAASSAPATFAAPTAPAPSTTAPAAAEHVKRATVDDPVTLNTATLDDLERLPGIGPKRAAAILELRQKLGRFRQVEDLMRVKGVGRATLKKLRPIVRLD